MSVVRSGLDSLSGYLCVQPAPPKEKGTGDVGVQRKSVVSVVMIARGSVVPRYQGISLGRGHVSPQACMGERFGMSPWLCKATTGWKLPIRKAPLDISHTAMELVQIIEALANLAVLANQHVEPRSLAPIGC